VTRNPTAHSYPHLPASQRTTQALVDQFNADERDWQKRRSLLDGLARCLRKMKRMRRR
jgi:hypothetical protein